ncbi:kinase-like domain-containing protein [Rhizophagus irregularis DAOM 181602=DAOM 197198]|nr:kinase-like domain-containing protein [Rhizophagus irregularis DAOM 181602=DAOM 197198]
MLVELKSLNNPKNITLEFMNEIKNSSRNITLEFMNEITQHHKINNYASIIKLYGISQDPKTQNYIMILDYAENGSLRKYLDMNYNIINWKNKIDYLYDIAFGLNHIHFHKLIHRDLHVGNILHRDANPLNRPKAIEICKILREWAHEFSKSSDSDQTELKKQIKEVEGSNNELFTSIRLGSLYKTHSEAIYTKSLLNNIVDSQQTQRIDISPKINDSQQIDILLQIGDSQQIDISKFYKN